MFKSIEYKLIFFILLLIASVAFATYFYLAKEVWYAIFFVILILVSLVSMKKSYDKFNQNILFLLNALDNGDYSFHFTESKLTLREKELNTMLNRIKDILVRAKKDVIENEKFLSIILESVSTGIVILDDRDNVQITNNAACQLLGMPVFTHLNQLRTVDETFPGLFRDIQPGDNVQIKVVNDREENQISLRVSRISMKRGTMKIITLNNIGNELEAKEMESWIRLIRVMTHEIMNSIAPITSLSETLLFSYKTQRDQLPESSIIRNTIDALETINSTAKGLITFVNSYRQFTGIPKPQLKEIDLVPLLEKILSLESFAMQEKGIESCIIPIDKQFIIEADESQITQILVNLVKNAIEAIQPDSNGCIKLIVQDREGKIQIDVCNNGNPVPAEVAPHIFIPFFTTKDSGTGIGLSISRYIMRLHGGNLKHHTTSDGWTVFSMLF